MMLTSPVLSVRAPSTSDALQAPGLVDRHVRDREAPFLQPPDGIQDGLVLNRGGDDVRAATRLQLVGEAKDREVVGFRRAAREGHLVWLCRCECGELFACSANSLACRRAVLMRPAGLVAELDA